MNGLVGCLHLGLLPSTSALAPWHKPDIPGLLPSGALPDPSGSGVILECACSVLRGWAGAVGGRRDCGSIQDFPPPLLPATLTTLVAFLISKLH